MISMYRYQETYYTGTVNQPDVLSIFIKARGQLRPLNACHFLPMANFCDYVPIASSLLAIPRIKASVQTFFSEASQVSLHTQDPHLLECWNACKNFIRAIIAFVPIAGNVTLIVFDRIRDLVIVEAKIASSLLGQQDVAGVALDGKILFTVSMDRLRETFTRNNNPATANDYYFRCIGGLGSGLLQRASERNSQQSITELFLQLRDRLNQGRLPGHSAQAAAPVLA